MTSLSRAADHRVGPQKSSQALTPWNPSRKALARVRDKLPIPKICPYCAEAVVLVSNSEIYQGQAFGEWPWAYKCVGEPCGAYVGLHPFTNLPLGTLATPAMRHARKKAKAVFQTLFRPGQMSRDQAYAWLAGRLDIPVSECHFGWFDVAMCERALAVCRSV